jgi:hypothetical protein
VSTLRAKSARILSSKDTPSMLCRALDCYHEDLIAMSKQAKTQSIPPAQALQLRQLSHDLSNALEVILQTSYLLGTVELNESARQWREMLDQGVQQATGINKALRDYIRTHSENAAG